MRALKQGFTLIEILIVLAIVSITAAMTMLAFGDFGASRKAEVTAEQFADYLRLIQQRAILEMNTLGVTILKKGYKALRFSEELGWQPLAPKGLFYWQAFPSNVIVQFQNRSQAHLTPEIIVNPSGDMNSFSLYFGTHEKPKWIRVLGWHNGTIKVIKQHE